MPTQSKPKAPVKRKAKKRIGTVTPPVALVIPPPLTPAERGRLGGLARVPKGLATRDRKDLQKLGKRLAEWRRLNTTKRERVEQARKASARSAEVRALRKEYGIKRSREAHVEQQTKEIGKDGNGE